MSKSIFKTWSDDPVGKILGTGYRQFISNFGVDGLAKESGDRLDILAVYSHQIGKGNFRRFIAACQSEYRIIGVWAIGNPIIEQALGRYGFTPEIEIASTSTEKMEGMRWDKKA